MLTNYARDLDLNLLRVFVVVATQRSVTRAAAKLYLTQPAVSAAIRRLTATIGAPLFVRHGRGLALTTRGEQLLARSRVHLSALIEAALSPAELDLKTSERAIRLGMADAAELWLLPPLLRALAREAPRMRVVSIPVNFRTVVEAFATQRLDAAVTVADDLPPMIEREALMSGGFVCLFDPRHARVGRLGEADYFAREHIVVSYNGDLRGVVEDVLRKQRNIRCSVSTFAHLGALIEGSALLATVPELVAQHLRRVRPQLAIRRLPFTLRGGAATELLWPKLTDDDVVCRFVRDQIRAIARGSSRTHMARERRRRPAR